MHQPNTLKLRSIKISIAKDSVSEKSQSQQEWNQSSGWAVLFMSKSSIRLTVYARLLTLLY